MGCSCLPHWCPFQREEEDKVHLIVTIQSRSELGMVLYAHHSSTQEVEIDDQEVVQGQRQPHSFMSAWATEPIFI